MVSDRCEEISETDIAYWRRRVLSLELLVSELLTKNQVMRFMLEEEKRYPLPAKLLGRIKGPSVDSLAKSMEKALFR
jgi:hypothetical protein